MKKKAEILEELTTLKSTLGNYEDEIQLFHVPEGYFEYLPGQILKNIKASQIETEFNLTIDKTVPYTVPTDYFEQFGNNVLQQIRKMQPVIEGKNQSFDDIGMMETYQLPDGFFASFEQNLYKKLGIQQDSDIEETETISPLLASLKDKTSYTAPHTYFNAIDFSEKIQRKTIERKVIEHPSVKSIKWARWAAAASIILIFFVGGFRFLSPDNTISSEAKFEKSLAQIPETQIREWLSNNIDETDINSLSASLLNSKDLKTKQALENITEDDIEAY
ncbi:hypothetical protein F0919_02245 [Taibaiella lutea]|uniref:Uncharacterized protein n=1 Tax=Taibaiella lutea TaxID=2608001 RepID=A0A5M6CTL1_9BACT|nr:hypothetical protein [Taibaiella lutea]KAA5536509.1 hypothetical protein F0919_02245 [Taibaiella lutea]